MIKFFSDKVSYFFSSKQIINENDLEICSYGLQIIFSLCINTTISLLIGLLLNKIIYTIIFLVSFCSIRQFSGGFHAKSNRLCIITFTSIFSLSMVFGIELNKLNTFPIYVMLISTLSFLCIYLLAPVCHVNNPLNKNRYKKNKFFSRVISIILFIIILIGCVYTFIYNYIIYISLALFWVSLLLIIQISINIKNKEL
ncbi:MULTISPECIES: accessory gene regulator B family protein [unclassified Clostridioides]|uniref:accessory gene regulator ArgB-like protein n=1 Tax=unclassified Clostridioides TaxID=2635829 RepID=UPI001D10E3A0|nr:accessory gene regulator B family protein [Clostridioides sp. ZZV14-6150]MCC0667879.1 accessory gene regulator B family protein [Clostridioides sp. ZZV14-6153]MCC0723691.1 accessory gene regulator B family protein [Clostridioides sp. ZZV14-6104]MCC0724877.1 accessory gene regulator B family protein [Clostridioides sp. ZZV14-6045]MCC0730751.1 accessory gene regulator B family protein [Clostridioides sp. ZZV14-6048]MCC0736700.1 accessory gene regulator B family protein [Clostridioides sp. ZZV